jgi:hypothetical protein
VRKPLSKATTTPKTEIRLKEDIVEGREEGEQGNAKGRGSERKQGKKRTER